MAEPTAEEPPPPAPDPNSTIPPPPPPLDFNSTQFYHSVSDQTPIGEMLSDLGFPVDSDGEFELTFNDVYFPAENETFILPLNSSSQEEFGDFTPEISADFVPNKDANESVPKDSNDRSSGAPTPLSSQGSDNRCSDVSEATNIVVDQKVKVEEEAAITKRKKEEIEEEDMSDESRNSKYRRSGDASAVTAGEEEDEKKKKARLMRNRESAQLSRQRKKHYVEELEEKVRNMQSAIADLNGKISYFATENATLKHQLGGKGMFPPPIGMYPNPPMAAPMAYPWMPPCPPYMVKQQGSQVPLIPIPRLKPLGISKAKKSVAKTKKVASISFLGLLFCLFLFGALAPVVNVNYGGISGAFYGNYKSNHRLYNQQRNRVLDTSRRDSDRGTSRNVSATESSGNNGSEPLVASLFVPRNDKLVKIDGNLIINSILASEKAVTSRKASESKADLVIPVRPLADVERAEDKALSAGAADILKDQFKTKAANGEIQQWFREGVAGPMFSSGMCTEVFQFDISSTSGAIVPASPVGTNISAEHNKNTSDSRSRKSRRTLRGLHIPLPTSDFNLTKVHQRNSTSKEIKPASSMVVSVLVDPREGGDGDIEGIIKGPKSLSRVFVVVLMDSAKYVTYSCVLPRLGAPHLVTT